MSQQHQGGLNAIEYQGDSLAIDIAKIVEKLIETDQWTQKGIEKARLCSMIKDRTGLNLELEFENAGYANAAVLPPYLAPNHSFFNTFTRVIAKDYFAEDIRKQKGDKEGWVDRKTSKVGGFYSEMPGKLYLTAGLAKACTPLEISAIILHEYGHLFNYFNAIHDRFHDMSVMSRAIAEANGIKDVHKRRDVLTYALNKTGIEVNDPNELASEQLADLEKVDELAWGMYVDGSVRPQEDTGDREYNWRANEQLADQFAVMHGAGTHLASGLRKIMDSPFNKYTSSKGTFIFTEVLKTLGVLFFPTGILFLLLYLYTDEADLTYDEMPKRLRLIKQNLVGEIEKGYTNPQMVKRLKEDIEFIRQVEASIYNRKTYFDWIQGIIVPRIRRLNKQTKKNTTIENLVHNDLFVAAINTKR